MKIKLMVAALLIVGCQIGKAAEKPEVTSSPACIELMKDYFLASGVPFDPIKTQAIIDCFAVNPKLQTMRPNGEIDSDGWTELHFAAGGNRLDEAKTLVKKGADVNAITLCKSYKSVLQFAVVHASPEFVHFLLNNGANVHYKDGCGNTAIYWAQYNQEYASEITAILKAAYSRECIELKKAYFSASGVPFDPIKTDAMRACFAVNPNLESMRSNDTTDDNLRKTDLMGAAIRNDVKEAGKLLEKGATINAEDLYGKTALNYAARHGNLEMVSLLVNKGANVSVRDKLGATALESIGKAGRPEIIAILEANTLCYQLGYLNLLQRIMNLEHIRCVDASGKIV